MARYNSTQTSSSISTTATIATPNSGAFTELTGTAPYTVTVPPPASFPGQLQQFFNSTSGVITLASPTGVFNGSGSSGTSSQTLPAGATIEIVSDGTNYIILNEDGGPIVTSALTVNGASSLTGGLITLTSTGTGTMDNVTVGGTTKAAGSFLALTATGQVTFSAGTASTTTGTGTVVITGGLGASGAANFGGSVTATSFTGTINTAAQTSITSVGILTNLQTTSLGVGTSASGTSGEIRATGQITAYYSDDNLKTRLGQIENALDKVCSLEGFYYEANETAQALGYPVKREVGVSAQSTQKVLPEIVPPAPIDSKYLTVQYDRFAPLLIEAIKELRAEVETLKGIINGK